MPPAVFHFKRGVGPIVSLNGGDELLKPREARASKIKHHIAADKLHLFWQAVPIVKVPRRLVDDVLDVLIEPFVYPLL